MNYTVHVREPGTYAVKSLYTYAEKEVHRDAAGKIVGEIRFDLTGKPAAVCTPPRATQGWHFWDYGQIATISFPEAEPQLLTFRYRRGNNWAYLVFERIGDKWTQGPADPSAKASASKSLAPPVAAATQRAPCPSKSASSTASPPS